DHLYIQNTTPFVPTLPSFPTRRSSDLHDCRVGAEDLRRDGTFFIRPAQELEALRVAVVERVAGGELGANQSGLLPLTEEAQHARSEEHTSELQSRGHLVCRLLLEKKNT